MTRVKRRPAPPLPEFKEADLVEVAGESETYEVLSTPIGWQRKKNSGPILYAVGRRGLVVGYDTIRLGTDFAIVAMEEGELDTRNVLIHRANLRKIAP